MDCPDLNTLMAFAQQGAAADASGKVQEHIDGCSICFQTVVELALGNDLAPEEDLPTADDVVEDSTEPSHVSGVLSLAAVGLETALGLTPVPPPETGREAQALPAAQMSQASLDEFQRSPTSPPTETPPPPTSGNPLIQRTEGAMEISLEHSELDGLSVLERSASVANPSSIYGNGPPKPPNSPYRGQDEAAFPPGTDIDQYRILRLLGRGGMGEVYLAKDLNLGRRVALKIVKPTLLGEGDAVERFLFEARTTAVFNHPNIVTVYGVGSVEGAPYVALEFLEGQDLRARVAQSPPGLHESLRIILAVTQAVDEAHRHGILHRDLKPANILIPTDGRVRVVDFGLALQIEVEGLDALQTGLGENPEEGEGKIRGTPAYMSPEQWRAEKVSPATDVWAIGLMLHELCLGCLPYRARNLVALGHLVIADDPVPLSAGAADLPDVVLTLLQRTLIKDPSRRASTGEVIETLRDVLFEGRLGMDSEESPFRGLLPFAERHTHLFFGRSSDIAAGIERLRASAMLAVVGASGAGKSSFVQAGLIPRLREQGRWIVLRVRPGTSPLRRLATKVVAALAQETGSGPVGRRSEEPPSFSGPAVGLDGEGSVDAFIVALQDLQRADEVETFVDDLKVSPRRLGLALTELAHQRGARVLLLVDQMEELFTLTADPEERRIFAEAVCDVADDSTEPVRTVFTLREDFLGRFALLENAGDVLLRHVMVLGAPGPELLRDVVLKPLEMVGYGVDSNTLVDRMVATVDSAASLPLLQFTARLLWDRRDRSARQIREADYDAIGGVEGALAKHADDILAGLAPGELATTRSLFMRLVTPQRTRRVVTEADLLDGLSDAGSSLLGRLTAARLLTVRRSELEDARVTRVEIAHEALIEAWPTLGHWLDEGREELILLNDAGQAAQLWHRRGRQAAELWEGEALRDALRARERTTTPVPSQIESFLEASTRRDRTRRRWRKFLMAAIPLVLIVIAAVLGIQKREAAIARDRAHAEREVAQVERLLAIKHRREALAEDARGAFERGAYLEARAKLRVALEGNSNPPPSLRALLGDLVEKRVVWSQFLEPLVYGLTWSPDGRWLAAAQQNKAVVLYARDTGERRVFLGHSDQVLSLDFSPDGESVASISLGGEVRIFETATGRSIRSWRVPYRDVNDIQYVADGRILALASPGRVTFWDPNTGVLSPEYDPIKPGTKFLEYMDGLLFLYPLGKQPGRALFWTDGQRGELIDTPVDHDVNTLQAGPDGPLIVYLDKQGMLHKWNPKTKSKVGKTTHIKEFARKIALTPDGDLLATAGHEKTTIWHLPSGRKHVLPSHPLRLRLSPDGRFLGATGIGRPVFVWDLDGLSQAQPTRDLVQGPIYGMALTPDDQRVITASPHASTVEWNLADGRIRRLLGSEASATAVAVDGAQRHVAVGRVDGGAKVVDYKSGRVTQDLKSIKGELSAAAFPSSDTFAYGLSTGELGIWSLSEDTPVYTRPTAHSVSLTGFSQFRDGRFISSDAKGWIHQWDLASGEKLRSRLAHGSSIFGVRLTRDGKRVLTGGHDRKLRLWSTDDLGLLSVESLPARINDLVVSPVADRFAVAGSDGNIYFFEPDQGYRVFTRASSNEINVIRYTSDGQTLVTGGDDGTVRSFDAETGEPRWWNRAALREPLRVFTHRGWLAPSDDWAVSVPESAPVISAIEDRAVEARQTGDGRQVCMETKGGIEVWAMDKDQPLVFEDGEEVVPLQDRCLIRTKTGVKMVGHGSAPVTLALDEEALALGDDEEEALVITRNAVLRFGIDGQLLSRYPTGFPPTAATMVRGEKPRLLLGFSEGSIEVREQTEKEVVTRFLEATFAAPVVRLEPGPLGTVLAGFGDGYLGLWDTKSGVRLSFRRAVGEIVSILQRDGMAHVITNQGDHVSWDLGVFVQDRCDLLREAWALVPVVWERGRAVSRPPPRSHECRRR